MGLSDKKAQLKQLALCFLIIGFVLLVYGPAIRGGFVWDDKEWIRDNPTLRTFEGLKSIWIQPEANVQYYPLMFSSFWIEYHLWGLNPFMAHLINALLHALNAILLWRVLILLEVPGAWVAAVIFGLHPVNLESVAWVVERKNVLSGFFYLSSLLIYLRFSLSDNRLRLARSISVSNGEGHSKGKAVRLYLVAMGLFVCALLSKSVTCTLPAVVLLILWWKRDRISLRDVQALIPFFLIGILFALTTARIEGGHVGAQGEAWQFSLVEHCLIAGRAIWFYADKLFWPHMLIFVYPRWAIDTRIWWQYLYPIAAVAVIFALWSLRGRMGKGPVVAVLIFVGNLFPSLGFFNFYFMRYSFVADHFQYLASMGLIPLYVVTAKMIVNKSGIRKKEVGLAVSITAFVILGALTWIGGRKYKSPETIWADTIGKNPGCWMAQNGLASALVAHGRIGDAIRHYSEALRMKPDYEIAHYNLALCLEAQGRIAEAIPHYYEALRLDPGFVGLHFKVGLALEKLGKLSEAIRQYNEAVRINPDFVEGYMHLGNAFVGQGRLDDAMRQYSKALQINPGLEGAHNNLGAILFHKGRMEEAIRHFREALRIRPGYGDARDNLDRALAAQRKAVEE